MIRPPWIRAVRRALLAAGASAALAAGLLTATATASQAATQGPCDIYAAGGTPCVAAHSTTRALYGAYNGPLYQVKRASDNATKDIGLLSAGGYADAAQQDSFCANTSCVITVIYDQSPKHNNLTQALKGHWPGPAENGNDNLANAFEAPVTVGG
ncbi:MAG: alpha-N-arabinofuranosidase, partial [Nonomuraea sp.]|nr:alpha-N-arabinofuranosidase [Nonomuraea sp.]